jgi:hypothetical protein
MERKLSAEYRTGQIFCPVHAFHLKQLPCVNTASAYLTWLLLKLCPDRVMMAGFLRQLHQNNYIGLDCGVVIAIDALENRRNRRGRYRNGQG